MVEVVLAVVQAACPVHGVDRPGIQAGQPRGRGIPRLLALELRPVHHLHHARSRGCVARSFAVEPGPADITGSGATTAGRALTWRS